MSAKARSSAYERIAAAGVVENVRLTGQTPLHCRMAPGCVPTQLFMFLARGFRFLRIITRRSRMVFGNAFAAFETTPIPMIKKRLRSYDARGI